MHGDEPGGPIRWRMHLPVPPERVFAALDSDEGRAAFWAESAIDYMGGEARFELTADEADGTDLLLTHYGVALEEWNETHAGWLNVLFPLKVWVVYGIEIRNHDPMRSWNQGYADQ